MYGVCILYYNKHQQQISIGRSDASRVFQPRSMFYNRGMNREQISYCVEYQRARSSGFV